MSGVGDKAVIHQSRARLVGMFLTVVANPHLRGVNAAVPSLVSHSESLAPCRTDGFAPSAVIRDPGGIVSDIVSAVTYIRSGVALAGADEAVEVNVNNLGGQRHSDGA